MDKIAIAVIKIKNGMCSVMGKGGPSIGVLGGYVSGGQWETTSTFATSSLVKILGDDWVVDWVAIVGVLDVVENQRCGEQLLGSGLVPVIV
jgi:hypothetical protein